LPIDTGCRRPVTMWNIISYVVMSKCIRIGVTISGDLWCWGLREIVKRVKGPGLRISGQWLRVGDRGLGLRVKDCDLRFEIKDSGLKIRVMGFEIQLCVFWFRGHGLGFRPRTLLLALTLAPCLHRSSTPSHLEFRYQCWGFGV
jgi:hypothetical protein